VPDCHALQDHRPGAHPYVVSDYDRFDSLAGRGLLGSTPPGIERMAVEVGDPHPPGEQAVTADSHRVGDPETAVVADERVVPDNEFRVGVQPVAENERGL